MIDDGRGEATGPPADSSVDGSDSDAEGRAEGDRAAALERQVERLDREVARRDDRLRETQAALAGKDQELARLRRELDAVRRRRSVRLAIAAADRARPLVRGARLVADTLRSGRVELNERLAERSRQRALRASARDELALVAAIRSGSRDRVAESGALVSIVVGGDGDDERLAACLESLRRTTHRNVEVVVHDRRHPGRATPFPAPDHFPFPITIIGDEPNGTGPVDVVGPPAAGAADLVLFMGAGVEPINDDWLSLLVETSEASGAAAVGPRLIHARRRGRAGAAPDSRDLSLASRGVAFDRAHGVPVPEAIGAGDEPTTAEALGVAEVPALAGACILVRRSALAAIGDAAGIDDGAVDPGAGPWGVDLSLRLRAAGERLVFDGRAAMWQHAPVDAARGSAEERAARDAADREEVARAWGPRLFRDALADALMGDARWSADPFHVGITVTRDDPSAGFGDWYTGHELGDALERLGWRVSYLERHDQRWYRPDPSIEAVIVLLESCDIRRLPRHIVTLAWIRNWAQRWLDQPWMDDFDLVFASSARIAQLVRERSSKVASVLPIATNVDRFRPQPADPELACDVLFVGSYWGQHRDVVDALPALAATGASVHVYGRGWDELPAFAGLHRGFLDYDRVPAAYASARIVVDDAASSTRPFGSVNSRVFDALATGAVVVSNGVPGVEELFDTGFPTWSTSDELIATVRSILADRDAVASIAARYRDVVLARHTYARRGAAVRDALVDWTTATRWGIRIGVPGWEQVDQWGDYFFARAIQRILERTGVPTRVHLLPEWTTSVPARDDVSLHLFGLSTGPIRPAQVNLLWQISHPERASESLYEQYDHVFVASDAFAARMASDTRVPVEPLHQATDPERFQPEPGGPAHELLFIANSRKVPRKITTDLAGTTHDLAVYGANWTADLIAPRYVKGESIPNADLARYYTAAAIVLNDHWDDMRANGFMSNRLYDALACGACVISDDVDGIEAEFDGAVLTYREPRELELLIDRYLADPPARRLLGERGRTVVLERHTFEDRVATLVAAAAPLLADRSPDVRRDSRAAAGAGA